MAIAMFVMLTAVAPLRVPDLQVEAATANGIELPELADAVARALVASGARVVLRGPTSGACEYCARVTVLEMQPGVFHVTASQDRHAAGATLKLPAGSSLFDRARAIAIQARLLVTWRGARESRGDEIASRPRVRKPAAPTTAPPPEPAPALSAPALPPFPAWEPSRAPIATPAPEPAPEPPRPPAPDTESRTDLAAPAPGGPAERTDRKPAPRVEPRPVRPQETRAAEPRRSETASVDGVDATRTRPAGAPSPWPWIPTALGAGAALGAGLCAWTARNHYDALADQTRDYESAKAVKATGERWQMASVVLSAAAVVGLTTGIVGFATRSPGRPAVTALAAPLPGGGMLALAGAWP